MCDGLTYCAFLRDIPSIRPDFCVEPHPPVITHEVVAPSAGVSYGGDREGCTKSPLNGVAIYDIYAFGSGVDGATGLVTQKPFGEAPDDFTADTSGTDEFGYCPSFP